ncbi:MAG: hypothetical protein J5544_00290 [Clostridia bacterium]|nr:hypothetical protein [Clostridia bacterium]
MKRRIFIFAAVMLAAAMTFAACSGDNMGTTAAPNTAGMGKESPSPAVTDSMEPDLSAGPTAVAGETGTPDLSSERPDATSGPVTSAEPDNVEGSIEGFMEGKVVDPEDVPEITDILGHEFPEHTVQSLTFETYKGSQAYRAVLQGEGELSRIVYVFADGSLLIPAGGD